MVGEREREGGGGRIAVGKAPGTVIQSPSTAVELVLGQLKEEGVGVLFFRGLLPELLIIG